MTSPLTPDPLTELASLLGIEPEFWDIWGERHVPDPATQKAILQSLGIEAETAEQAAESLAAIRREEWTRPLPPTLVISGDSAARLPIRFRSTESAVAIRVETEGQQTIDLDGASAAWAESATQEIGGEPYVERTGRWELKLPYGYHRAIVRIEGRDPIESRLIVTPDRAWLPKLLREGKRSAGVAVSLYGVRSRRNWGCGDFTDAKSLLVWVHDFVEAGFLALNPLHAIDNRQPYNISPYLPNSTFWRNPLYIDVERVAEFAQSPAADTILDRPAVRSKLQALRNSELVEYESVWRLKKFFLALLYRQLCKDRGSRRYAEFERFLARGGKRLYNFALYCALWEWIHRRNPDVWIWQEWPEPYRSPESPEVAAFAARHATRIRFHMYMQWVVDQQLESLQRYAVSIGLPIGLYHDLALAVDKCGADLWAYRDSYVAGCRVGSPPDGFAPEGQDWAFPPPNARRIRDAGYQLFIDGIRANSRHGGALRIDHVMRLFRLFWIPDGIKAKDGAYVRDFPEDLLRILALESHRGEFLIVGEDLGTVTDFMRDSLDRFGILSYKILYFERSQDGRIRPPEEYARQTIVSSTTHDLPTLAGFWTNRDIEARKDADLLGDESAYFQQLTDRANDKQLLLDAMHEHEFLPAWFPRNANQVADLTGELHNAFIGFLVSTPSLLMVLNQEDLTKELDQQNLPASTWQYPNWRRKMKYTVEELTSLQTPLDFAAMFRNWLQQAGRSIRTQ